MPAVDWLDGVAGGSLKFKAALTFSFCLSAAARFCRTCAHDASISVPEKEWAVCDRVELELCQTQIQHRHISRRFSYSATALLSGKRPRI